MNHRTKLFTPSKDNNSSQTRRTLSGTVGSMSVFPETSIFLASVDLVDSIFTYWEYSTHFKTF